MLNTASCQLLVNPDGLHCTSSCSIRAVSVVSFCSSWLSLAAEVPGWSSCSPRFLVKVDVGFSRSLRQASALFARAGHLHGLLDASELAG